MIHLTVIIDSREDIETISQIIPSKYSDIFKVEKLDLGDFLITKPNGKTVLLERKTIGDFCRSVHDRSSGNGTFQSKMMRMSALADKRGLLLEGDWISGDDGRLYYQTKDGLRSYISMLEFRNFIENRQNEGCQYYHTRSLQETIDTLIAIHFNQGSQPPLKVVDWDQFGWLLPGIGKVGWSKIKATYQSPCEAWHHIEEWKHLSMKLTEW